jgi:molybdopterin-guanine dinucleotide biosynthesis protein A
MGAPKASLEWHGSTLLRRVAGIVARGADGPVVVVRAPGQPLPELPREVEVVEDAREGRGPLQGMAAGLAALVDRADAAFVSSTDVPLLHPAFVRRVLAAIDGDVDAAVPHARGFRHPLAAAYRVTLLPLVEELIAAERMKPAFLFDGCRVRWLDEDALLADRALAVADPRLESLRNVNEPADYEAARALPGPDTRIERFGILRGGGARDPLFAPAATLAEAAAAAGLGLDAHVVAAVGGDRISRDPEYPLADGDTVQFLSADAGG